MDLLTIIGMLVIVMDPLGNVPVFMSVLKEYEGREKLWIIAREMIIALVILTAFLFFGKVILIGFGITEPALGLAGGILLFLISFKMIYPKKKSDDEEYDEPMIVPLAMPLVAGPSTIAVLMLLATQYSTQMMMLWSGLFIAWLITAAVLLSSDFLAKMLKPKGLRAIEKLMGMILLVLSIQLILDGIADFISSIIEHK